MSRFVQNVVFSFDFKEKLAIFIHKLSCTSVISSLDANLRGVGGVMQFVPALSTLII